MKKAIIMRKNQNFFYTEVATFIQQKSGFISFLIGNFDQKEPITAEFGEEKVFLKIFHKINGKGLGKIITSDRLQLNMKLWLSIGGKYDEKCQFEFNGINYDFEIKGYQLAPGFVLKPHEIEKIEKFAGDEPMQIIAELTIGLSESK